MKATHVSDEVAADDNGISASANPSNNADLTIGGALHSGNTVTNAGGRIVEITSAGDDSAIDATVIGTDVNGDALSETIDLADTVQHSVWRYSRCDKLPQRYHKRTTWNNTIQSKNNRHRQHQRDD